MDSTRSLIPFSLKNWAISEISLFMTSQQLLLLPLWLAKAWATSK